MSNKNIKRFTAITLAATMAFGGALTAFAADGDGVSTGTGTYEGGEIKYPTLSVTLPTIPAGTYDYIADPNGLIEKAAGHYADSTFTGDKGIFFLTSTADNGDKTYTEKSAALTLSNENAQDIDVTVKLEQANAGDTNIQYASTGTFEAEDTANKIYLALTDNAASDAKVSALSSSSAATLTTTVAGKPENYEAKYNNGYVYEKKADAAGWDSCSFAMTGAINKNATWGDDVTFPTVQVTWSYAEHQDAPTITETSVSATNKVAHFTAPAGVTITKLELNKTSGQKVNLAERTHYTLDTSGGTITFVEALLTGNIGNKIKVYFSDDTVKELSIEQ